VFAESSTGGRAKDVIPASRRRAAADSTLWIPHMSRADAAAAALCACLSRPSPGALCPRCSRTLEFWQTRTERDDAGCWEAPAPPRVLDTPGARTLGSTGRATDHGNGAAIAAHVPSDKQAWKFPICPRAGMPPPDSPRGTQPAPLATQMLKSAAKLAQLPRSTLRLGSEVATSTPSQL
jgi:hypothetical protein